MVGARMSRRARRFFKKIQRSDTKYGLQELASSIQTEVDKRLLSYDEALMLGNMIQNRADQVPGDSIVYAISGISDAEHEILLKQLLNQWKRQGKAVTIDRFSEPEAGGADPV